MDPIIGGALIGAGANLLGGIFGNKSAQRQADQQEAVQREFATHGIRWKVEDAKAAGLHPLFALGGMGATYTPPPINTSLADSLGAAGQTLGRAVAAQETLDQRKLRELQMRELESKIGENDARAAYYRSQATGRGVTPGQVPPAFPGGSADVVTNAYVPVGDIPTVSLNPVEQYSADFPGKHDLVRAKPSEIPSSSAEHPWVTAGPARAGYDRHRITKRMEMLLPRNEEGWSEGIESVPIWMWGAVYQANRDYYGKDFWRLALQELGPDNAFVRWLISKNRYAEIERYLPNRSVLDEMSRDYRNKIFDSRR